ncbi:LPS export ABC transporter permease LptF [Alcanivorax quisquiliarum]|uniref:Lipopolysaccharide export system permease protein LptF n=1 Tax=Alcanivorax quisquiliarum TaxID=2933565 RepID=A0ABT0E7N4_9GAMM|nr:LPS export ABC transporter permease LptF [Alcanivorax quisquiliarum]MCK0537753.1 LPS export ABC transporter permease LptF [Alcanivorax quisquiliarum]
MILYRYINRQLFVTTVVVTFVLVMVLVSGRFIKYLAEAAVGDIAADALFLIMAFRLPEFLQMILPLSLYIGVLLVLGRMYVDNEMVVLKAGGVSEWALMRAMALPVLMTAALIALFSLYVTPKGDAEVAQLFEEQRGRSVLELLAPGRFHVRGSDGGYRATYAESLNRDEGALERVFLSEFRMAPEGDGATELLTVWARQGRLVEQLGMTYLELTGGYQYQGRPGDADFRTVYFDRALVRVGREQGPMRPPKTRSWTTSELLASDANEARAELQWRLSLIVIVPLMALAAIPLARVSPRQGRFGKLIPAILIYMFYMGLLLVMRSAISDVEGDLPLYLHSIWIHLLAALLVVALYLVPAWSAKRRYGRGMRT